MHPSQRRLLTAMAVLLLGLVAALVWLEPPEQDAGDFESPVAVSPDQVEALTLTRPDAAIVATHTDGGWLLEAPLRARGDDGAFAGFVGVVDRLRLGPPIEELDPAVYGFDTPEATLVLTRADGTRHTLVVGTTAPVGFRTYVTLDGGPVRLAEGHPMTTLGRPVDALRDRTVHHFAESTVTAVQVRDEGTSWSLVRRDGAWFLGDGRRASTARVEVLLGAFAALQLESFQDQLADPDLAALGLAPPHASVTLTEAGGESTLAIGGERAGGVLVRTPAGQLGTVGEIAPLLPAPEGLLEDRVLPFSLREATALELTYAGVQVALTRDGEAWLRNGEPSATAKTHAVDLLTQLPAERPLGLPEVPATEDRLVARAGAWEVTVALGPVDPEGRTVLSSREPPFRLPLDALAVLENVALDAPAP